MFATILALPRWLKLAGIGALIVVAGLIWLKVHTDAAIRDDRARAQAEATERTLRAERAAESTTAAIRAANASASAETREAMKEAEDRDPAAAKAAAGPVSRAAAERLRQRSSK